MITIDDVEINEQLVNQLKVTSEDWRESVHQYVTRMNPRSVVTQEEVDQLMNRFFR